MAGTKAFWSAVLKIGGAVTLLFSLIAGCFAAWFAIQDSIAAESRQLKLEFHAMELQRDADDVAFAIYKVTHLLDEIDAREAHGTARNADSIQRKQLERELDILLRRQEQILEALEAQQVIK